VFLADDAAFENVDANLAYRLLVAARTRSPVPPNPPEVQERIDRLERLRQLDLTEAFEALAQTQPALRRIAIDPADRRATYWAVAGAVGPGTSDDLVVGSHTARSIVLAYILNRMDGSP
jgi:hypothetical protein